MPESDTDALLRDTLAYAKNQLAEQGAFAPFGTLINSVGERAVMGSDEEDVTAAIQGLRRAFHKEAAAGLLRASAVCFDIVTTPPGQPDETDAICVELESREGACKAVIVPYHAAGGEPSYGEPIEAEKPPEVFRGP